MTSLSQRREAVRPQSAQLADLDRSSPTPEAAWQTDLRHAIRDPAELYRHLELPAPLPRAANLSHFPLIAPLPFVGRIRPGDPHDPLLKQIWPDEAEAAWVPGFGTDPVGDSAATRVPGLLQKYHGRALLIAARACAIHCRYCFRREFPYQDQPAGRLGWEEPLEQLRNDPSLSEVILSGGDPLMLVDPLLGALLDQLEAIPHLRRLRIHTRLPIVIPNRVTKALQQRLAASRFTKVIVVHINHAHEIDDAVGHALSGLIAAGALLLNQSVLLKGVNDSVAALAALSDRLIENRVAPYYLHELDRVTGAAHFEASAGRGVQLIRELRQQLPGYAIPRLVREEAGQPHKTPLA
ncbi:EF-P beta-lysylation protein EpmB [Botrimarina hoheduenensis]|uniref:L-lysine 2,3-aminomutase n=1 Tax=Botrimarina hoheduenensis TaxID=2528000 RepID=A0A5C5W7R0_9BACT|nr:EF-P beta-lysylation protein EpmB [Botrimarina hoheduenensis]TWT46487.1 L-lysine 2,3-aminomutase [Botrimarina hoheduenensis]